MLRGACRALLRQSEPQLQGLLLASGGAQAAGVHTSTAPAAAARRGWWAAVAAAAAAGLAGLGAAASVALADEAEHGLHSADYPWPHDGFFSSYDHRSIRRGFQVYQQVCATCHSLEQIHFRDLVGVCYTEDEAKELASNIEVVDGPNDEGEMFDRPGKLSDKMPSPYSNEEAARFANGGAYPPDLSLITKARSAAGAGSRGRLPAAGAAGLRLPEPPAGVSVREGLHYNPYFPGGAIAMPAMLNDGGVEYDDGTPATISQQAKDVVTFLSWAAEPEADDRKLMGTKWMAVLTLAWLTTIYFKRWKCRAPARCSLRPSSSFTGSSRALAARPLRLQRAERRQVATQAGLFGLGVPELAVIAGVAALIFGPSKLPELGKTLGKTAKSFQNAAKEFEKELKEAAADTPPPAEKKEEEKEA
eukprot:scaffold10.g2323.t1